MNVRLILTTGLLLLLAACDGGYAPAYDPALAAQDARATIAVATAIAESERKAVRKTEAAQEYSAAETQRVTKEEMELLQRRQEATDVALDGERTSTAIAWGMETTRTAVAQQVAQSTVQAGVTATVYIQEQLVAAETKAAAQTAAKNEATRRTARTIGLWVVVIIVVVALSIVGILVLSWFLELQSAKGRLIKNGDGTFFLHPIEPNGRIKDYVVELAAGARVLQLGPGSIRDAEPDRVFQYDTAGNVLGSPMKTRRISKEWALKLLDAAAKMGWEDSITLPGHRELGWSSGSWQEARDYWVYFHVMEMIPMKDPRTNRTHPTLTITHPKYRTVGELCRALDNNELKLHHPIARRQEVTVA